MVVNKNDLGFIEYLLRFAFFKALSSRDKWGGQLKTTKWDIQYFMILELKGIKNYKTKN